MKTKKELLTEKRNNKLFKVAIAIAWSIAVLLISLIQIIFFIGMSKIIFGIGGIIGVICLNAIFITFMVDLLNLYNSKSYWGVK